MRPFCKTYYAHVSLEKQGLLKNFTHFDKFGMMFAERAYIKYNKRERGVNRIFRNKYIPRSIFLQWGGFLITPHKHQKSSHKHQKSSHKH